MAALAISAAVIVGTMGVSAASVDAKGTKKQFCKAAVKVGSNIRPSSNPTGTSKKASAKLEKSFHQLEAKAPTSSLKNAVATMSDFYGRIADGDDLQDIAGDAVAYGKAAVKFTKYLTTKCISVSIPDVSVPTLP
jgi:hypothetical protein